MRMSESQIKQRMETKEAISLAGSRIALADMLGITTQAVSAWGEHLPPHREWQLQAMRPEWFDAINPTQSELHRERLARLDRIARLADEIKKEVQLWRAN